MNNQRASNNIAFALQGDQTVSEAKLASSISFSFNIAQITNMTISVTGSSMSLLVWIEMRSCRNTSISAIAVLVNMEAMQSRFQSLDFTIDGNWASGHFLRL